MAISLTTGAKAQSAQPSNLESLPPVVVEADATSKQKSKKGETTSDVQADGVPPDGMIVDAANRTPTEAAKVGSTVSVVTQKEIDARSQPYLKDYLETLPGVSFAQFGPPGTQAGISVRGAGGKYVKVLVDGMDLSDPSGTATETAFEHLLVGDVSRIELVQGTQSTLYGGDAIAGLINIETKKATTPGLSQGGGVEYGTYNTLRGAYTTGYLSKDGSNISITGQGISTDGFSASATGREDDGYDNVTLSTRGEYFVSPTAKVFFAARTLEANLDIDGGPTIDNSDTVDVTQHAGRIGTEFSLLNGAFVNTIAFQAMTNERVYYGSYAGAYEGERLKGEYKGVLTFNEQLTLLSGVDWEQTGASSDSVEDKSAEWTGYYAQLMMEPIRGLILTGGGRLDEHSTFGSFETYRLTGAYLIPGTETKLRASYGTGFRVPSLDELYGSLPLIGFANYGNPDLQPETSVSWDAGVEQGFLDQRIRLGATYFELDTDNLISFAGYDPGTGRIYYVNIPGITHRSGVELTASALVMRGLAISGSYSYVDTETAGGDRLNYVPKHNVVLALDMVPMEKVALNVTAKGVVDTLGSGKVVMDDYVLLSAKASYELAPGMQAYVRGENLLDQDYQTYVGYGTPGLSVFGGITMALPNG